MRCPHCHANDYEVRLIERDDVYTGPLTMEAVIAINLVTCRQCGSWFIKAAMEYLQDAYDRHCAGEI